MHHGCTDATTLLLWSLIRNQAPESNTGTTQVVAPLLHERDMYLAWSLKRSKAVNGTKRVVGVVGKGHLRGVLYHLTHPEASSGLRCEPILERLEVLMSWKVLLTRTHPVVIAECLLSLLSIS